MGTKDTVTTKYMRQNEIFADAFNFFIYDGEQVVDPATLEELDTRQIEVPYGGALDAKQPVQKVRDVIKSMIAMTDKRAAYLLLGIENQSSIHYAMPIKNALYDILSYTKQVELATSSHKLSNDYIGASRGEFLSGFMKTDRLIPVITLTIYFDSKKWDGPLSLHDMLDTKDEKILSFISDYKINLITPNSIEDRDFDKFKTSLKEVLSFIKYADDKDSMKKIIESDEKFRYLGRNEIDLLNACTNAKLTIKKDEEGLNMCLAIEGMIKDAVEIAEKKAAEAEKKAAEKASKEHIESLFSAAKNLMKKMGWSVEQSLDMLNVTENERNQLMNLLQ